MKVTITATKEISHLDGVTCRVWDGVTEGGVPCKVFVHRLAVALDKDAFEFERELHEQMPPGVVIPLRKVL